MSDFKFFSQKDEPTDEIWIAENVLIHCKARNVNAFQRTMIKLVFGWDYRMKGKTK